MVGRFDDETLPLNGDQHVKRQPHSPRITVTLTRIVTFGLLILSVALHGLFYIQSRCPSERSAYAHLSTTVSVPWVSKSKYFGEGTDEDADRAWDAISIDNGSIALDPAYVQKMGLPHAQPFPWDVTRGIYILNGYHSMHCLKTLRTWIRQVEQGTPPDQPANHMLHCLDALRQDVECYADDTPRYTGFQGMGMSGTNQTRKCRDWNQMETWAQQYTACWRYMPELEREGRSILEDFRYCPEGSPYKERMEMYFSHVG